jgi:pimeloyl-ACP methyl ester carboxylesterase
MAYYECGPRTGTPVIFCHGFPEIAYSWRHQLKAMEAAGRWAIAPDLRGFGLTSRPDPIDAYDMEHLTSDLAGLLDHLEVEKAVFCGHDWGGIVVWQMPLLQPDRVSGVIALNTPFFRRGPVHPIEGLRASFGDQTYVLEFQEPGVSDALFARDVGLALRFIFRGPGSVVDGRNPQSPGGSRNDFAARLAEYDPGADPDQVLSDAEMQVFVDSFEKSGFTGGLNWYRNLGRNWERGAHLPRRIDGMPCLMILAEKDDVLTPALAEGMDQVIGDLETVLLAGVGHWSQQEQPERVNAHLLDWLDRRFP